MAIRQNSSEDLYKKLLDILKEKSESESAVECDDCNSCDPLIAVCTDCMYCLCQVCKSYHSKKKHNIVEIDDGRYSCPEHPSKKLGYFCETCEDFICVQCKATTSHTNHRCQTVEKMASEHRKALKNVITPLNNISDNLCKAKSTINNTKTKIEAQGKEINNKVDKHYAEQLAKLNQSHRQLKQEVQSAVQRKQEALDAQLKMIESAHESIKELQSTVIKPSDRQILMKKKQDTESQVAEAKNECAQLKLQPTESDTMHFDPISTSTLLGKLFTDTNPSQVINLPKCIFQNKIVELKILAKQSNGQDLTEGGDSVAVQVKLSTGNIIVGSIRDNGDGTYIASLVAEQVGEGILIVTINGQQIKGSPFAIKVTNNYYQAIKKPVKIIENRKLGQCWGIAFGDNGVWGVADSSNHCVHLFDGHDQDKFIKSIGTKGSNNGQFDKPISLAFDNNRCLYVVDNNNHRVQKFSMDGDYIVQFGCEGSSDAELKHPYGIAVHNGRVYVADSANKRISVFQYNSEYCTSFGAQWLGDPEDLTVDVYNQLLVADYEHHCVHIFTLDGHYIKKFGTPGTDHGQLSYPRSLTSDTNGHILVVDVNNHVSIFDKEGAFVHCFGTYGSKEGEFSSPYGIAISPKNGIHVCDHVNCRIQIFSIVLY